MNSQMPQPYRPAVTPPDTPEPKAVPVFKYEQIELAPSPQGVELVLHLKTGQHRITLSPRLALAVASDLTEIISRQS